MRLKLTSFDAVPEHMRELASIAESKGLSKSAYLRLLVAQVVRRNRQQKEGTHAR